MLENTPKGYGTIPIGDDFQSKKNYAFNPKAIAVSSAVIALFGTVLLFSKTGSVNKQSSESIQKFSADDSQINFTFKRKYYDPVDYFDLSSDSLFAYEILKSHLAVIEPSAPMQLHMYTTSRNTIKFSVCKAGTESCQTGSWTTSKSEDATADTIKFSCDPYSEFDISVTEIDHDGDVVRSRSGTGICLYVRREINSLTTEDREKFLDASHMLNIVSDTEGVAKYGDNYRSSSYLARAHHFNAAQQDQDHIHEGNGFLMQHVKMTNIFETSLQSVDPSIFLPYWDFTIDQANNLTAYSSPMFTEDYFGTMTKPKDVTFGYKISDDKVTKGKIPDGRWAGLKAEVATLSDELLPSAYGYLRAPWNMNPSPYLSRFAMDIPRRHGNYVNLPSCYDHYDIIQYDDLMDFYRKVAYDPHATVHTLVGGVYGCDAFDPLVAKGYIPDADTAVYLCGIWIFTLKELYRHGGLVPNTGCKVTDDIQSSTCGFQCKDSITSTTVMSKLNSYIGDYIDSTIEGAGEVWYEFMCGGGAGSIFPGDHLESASPADPSFWVIHPTIERLMHAKLMNGGFLTTDWPSDQINEYVCAKPKCWDNSIEQFTYGDECCYGHFENDQTYDGVAGSRDTKSGLTNIAQQKGTDPTSKNYNMNYVYDKFSWDHCKEDFDALFADMAADALTAESIAKGQATGWRRVTETLSVKNDHDHAVPTRKVPRPVSQEEIRAMVEAKRVANAAITPL